MDILETLRLSTTAIRRNKSRSFLTMLGIIIGVFAVISLISLGTGLQNYITRQFESMGSNNLYIVPGKIGGEGGGGAMMGFSQSASISKLKMSLVEDIQRIGYPVSEVIGEIQLPSVTKYRNKTKIVTVVGSNSQIASVGNLKVENGRFFNQSEVSGSKNVVVIGSEVDTKLFGDNNPVGEEIILSNTRFKVVGVLESRGMGALGAGADSVAHIPITAAQKITGNDSLQAIMVKFSNKDQIDEAKYKIKMALRRSLKEDDFSILSQDSILSTISSILGVLTTALGCIAAISLLVGGIGIMNIMLVSVTERTREIGIRKAVGAKNSDILTQFLMEAVFLSLVGGLIGVFLGYLGTLVVGKLLSANAFSWWSVFLALGVSSLVGIIFGVAPAAKASKLDPVEALRYE